MTFKPIVSFTDWSRNKDEMCTILMRYKARVFKQIYNSDFISSNELSDWTGERAKV